MNHVWESLNRLISFVKTVLRHGQRRAPDRRPLVRPRGKSNTFPCSHFHSMSKSIKQNATWKKKKLTDSLSDRPSFLCSWSVSATSRGWLIYSASPCGFSTSWPWWCCSSWGKPNQTHLVPTGYVIGIVHHCQCSSNSWNANFIDQFKTKMTVDKLCIKYYYHLTIDHWSLFERKSTIWKIHGVNERLLYTISVFCWLISLIGTNHYAGGNVGSWLHSGRGPHCYGTNVGVSLRLGVSLCRNSSLHSVRLLQSHYQLHGSVSRVVQHFW